MECLSKNLVASTSGFPISARLASDQFDINQDGQQFISTILAFLWMSEKDLGFDPTIVTSGDKRYLEIE